LAILPIPKGSAKSKIITWPININTMNH